MWLFCPIGILANLLAVLSQICVVPLLMFSANTVATLSANVGSWITEFILNGGVVCKVYNLFDKEADPRMGFTLRSSTYKYIESSTHEISEVPLPTDSFLIMRPGRICTSVAKLPTRNARRSRGLSAVVREDGLRGGFPCPIAIPIEKKINAGGKNVFMLNSGV